MMSGKTTDTWAMDMETRAVPGVPATSHSTAPDYWEPEDADD